MRWCRFGDWSTRNKIANVSRISCLRAYISGEAGSESQYEVKRQYFMFAFAVRKRGSLRLLELARFRWLDIFPQLSQPLIANPTFISCLLFRRLPSELLLFLMSVNQDFADPFPRSFCTCSNSFEWYHVARRQHSFFHFALHPASTASYSSACRIQPLLSQSWTCERRFGPRYI